MVRHYAIKPKASIRPSLLWSDTMPLNLRLPYVRRLLVKIIHYFGGILLGILQNYKVCSCRYKIDLLEFESVCV